MNPKICVEIYILVGLTGDNKFLVLYWISIKLIAISVYSYSLKQYRFVL